MAIQLEIILIAGLVAGALIIPGKQIRTEIAMSRRPSHHLAEQTDRSPVLPKVDIQLRE
jgi:hypothetical protein